MADPKRTLNIPMYETQVAPEGTPFDAEAIDAEIIDNGVPFGERVRSRATREKQRATQAARNVRVNGVKDAFFTQPMDAAQEARGMESPRRRARQEGRTTRDGADRLRSDQAADARKAQSERATIRKDAAKDPLSQLKLDTVQAGEAYQESLRASGILDAGGTKATQREQLSGMHQVYASMMVLQCVQPLQQGLSAENVASVLGMGASMWMLSPNFRRQVGSFAGQMGDVIKGKIEARGTKKDNKAQSKFDTLSRQGKGDQLASRWQKRLDSIQYAERGHRLPFTAQSAAMTEVALAESAYADMRRPGADPKQVQARYKTAMSALYEYVDADGLNSEDVSRSMRVIVGQRLEKDPSIANVFTELGHGRYTKSDPREVYINGTTDRATVWTGDFVDSYENRTISKGSFSMRQPADVNQHRSLVAETLAGEMTTATSAGELNDVFSNYVVASAVGRYPDVIDQVEDPAARKRMFKAQTMFASMRADGLTLDEQRFAYSAAYVDAIETVQRVNPELGNKWAAQYGESWREKVAEDMARYNDLGAEAERVKHGAGESTFAQDRNPASHQRFAATPDGDVRDAHTPSAPQDGPRATKGEAEDVVDAEVIILNEHQPDTEVIIVNDDDDIIDAELVDDDDDVHTEDDETLEADVVNDSRSVDTARRQRALTERGVRGLDEATSASADDQAADSIVDGLRSTSKTADYDQNVNLKSAAARVRRARVNQHYNEVETGGITGIGSDDAAPLQDVDFELG
jgi:hypothetical protein